MEVVKNFDLNRYLGQWYEIASIPMKFKPKNGTNSRVTYTMNDDQTITVVNETFVAGKKAGIEGKGWKADANSDEAKLLMKYWVPPAKPMFPITGEHWVLELEENYEYALVGQSSKKSLWVYCRTPELDDKIFDKLVETAKRAGFDISQLKKTPHPEGGDMEPELTEEKKGGRWFKSSK